MAGGVDYWVVFVQGLAVSGHCVGMCGGFVMAYSGAVVLSGQNRAARLALAHLLFNLGRMFTFSTLGFLAGWLGSVADLAAKAQGLQGVVALVAGVLMIFLGLGGLGVFPGFKLEREELVAGSGWFQSAMVRAVRSQSPLKPMLIGSLVGGAEVIGVDPREHSAREAFDRIGTSGAEIITCTPTFVDALHTAARGATLPNIQRIVTTGEPTHARHIRLARELAAVEAIDEAEAMSKLEKVLIAA